MMKRKKQVAVILCCRAAVSGSSIPGGQEGGCTAIKASCPEGISGCIDGCLGGGSCLEACPRQAISLRENGSAWVNRDRCVGCGKCVKVCPQQLIMLVPAENTIQPFCVSRAPAGETKEACLAGCVGCGICEKVCPAGAIHVKEGHAAIDQERCIACGMCAARCPRGVIHDANGIIAMK